MKLNFMIIALVMVVEATTLITHLQAFPYKFIVDYYNVISKKDGSRKSPAKFRHVNVIGIKIKANKDVFVPMSEEEIREITSISFDETYQLIDNSDRYEMTQERSKTNFTLTLKRNITYKTPKELTRLQSLYRSSTIVGQQTDYGIEMSLVVWAKSIIEETQQPHSKKGLLSFNIKEITPHEIHTGGYHPISKSKVAALGVITLGLVNAGFGAYLKYFAKRA